ncbi:MAG: 3-deoxy-manno-octulosonate cytidylyltransferase [Thermodesulfobacteriota bacterium]|nr:3-deoxy-manno-octulosonate cytidylyltransferase [Thermodesulfobacteriota bacterium]
MKIIAVIPARYASSRFYGKVLADINGKPMIQWVYEKASQAKSITKVIVATDDNRIYEKVKEFFGDVVMTSPDHNCGTERIAEVIKEKDWELIVNVQGDEPLLEPEMIDQAVYPFLEGKDNIHISTLKSKIKEKREVFDPNVVKVVTDRNDFAIYFSRAPIPFDKRMWEDTPNNKKVFIPGLHFKHIGLYVYKRDALLKFSSLSSTPLEEFEGLEQLRALENGLRIKVPTTTYDSIGVDTPEDLSIVRKKLK